MDGVARGSPRIALLDNTTNASYIFAKLLRRAGYQADFVQQPNTPYNHQPMWEDVDRADPVDQVADRTRSDRHWAALEREFSWVRPAWVKRPRAAFRDLSSLGEIAPGLSRVMPVWVLPFALGLVAPSLPIINALRGYDLVLVLGPSAGSAFLAGRPYAVITMGWDVFSLPFMTTSRSPLRRARGFLHRAALEASGSILGMPSMDLEFLARIGLGDRLRPFPVPVDVDGYAQIEPRSRTSVFGAELAERMEGRTVYFCPSRVSFAEKGQDLLLRAFAEVRQRGLPVFLLMLAWGHEVGRARDLIRELRLGPEDVCLWPMVLSKTRLIRAFKATDVGVIQFKLGGYGTLAREALAAGVPVISSYDPVAPQPHPSGDPAPIHSAGDAVSIRDAMIRLLDPAVRVSSGKQGQAWIRRNHQDAPLAMVERLVAELA